LNPPNPKSAETEHPDLPWAESSRARGSHSRRWRNVLFSHCLWFGLGTHRGKPSQDSEPFQEAEADRAATWTDEDLGIPWVMWNEFLSEEWPAFGLETTDDR
jgi:hypothetical protein